MKLHLNEIITALRARCPSFGGRVAGASQWAVDRLSEVEDPDYPAASLRPCSDGVSVRFQNAVSVG